MKITSIRQKLGIIVALGLIVTVVSLISYATYSLRKGSIEAAEKEAMATAERYAEQIKAEMEEAMDAARILAQVLVTVPDKDFNVNITREEVKDIITNIVKSNDFFDAVYTAWEPNAFDGQDDKYKNAPLHNDDGSFSPYIAKKPNGEIVGRAVLKRNQDIPKFAWYWTPKKTQKEYFDEPGLYPIDGKLTLMSAIVVPIIYNSEFKGIAALDIRMSAMQEITEKSTIYDGRAEISVISYGGVISAYNQDANSVGKKFNVVFPSFDKTEQEEIKGGIKKLEYKQDKLIVTTPFNVGRTVRPWQVRIHIPLDIITAEATSKMWTLIFIGIIFIIMGLALTIFFVIRIIRPLTNITNIAEKIAGGNLNVSIKVEQNDEIGRLSRSLNNMIIKLRDIVHKITASSSNIVTVSHELNSTSQILAQGASEQAAATEEVTSSMEEMVANIQQNSENSQQTEKIAITATDDINKVNHSVNETLIAMRRIAEKIEVIKEIASKTDLLAINAAVEAARAGNHGKGFSVVASEVKQLAEKSQEAATEIVDLAGASVLVAENSKELLEGVVPNIKRTTQLVQEISSASVEQNSGAVQINDAILQLNSVTQQNSSVSEQMSARATEFSSQAEDLRNLISYFNLENDSITDKYRKLSMAAQEVMRQLSDVPNELKNQDAKLFEKLQSISQNKEKEPNYKVEDNINTYTSDKSGANIHLEVDDKDYERF